MPELPDITVFIKNLKSIFLNARIKKVKILQSKKLTDKPADILHAIEGNKVKDIFRSGKEIGFQLTNNSGFALHLMLTGDLILFENKNEHKSTIAEIYFSNGKALALTDSMKNAWLRLQPEEKKGLDALDTALNFLISKKYATEKLISKSY